MKALFDFLLYVFKARDQLWRELMDTQNKYRNAWKRIEKLQEENKELKERLGIIEDEPEEEQKVDYFSHDPKRGVHRK